MTEFIPVASPQLNGNEKKYVNECIDTNWISSKGEFVNKFEDDFANYCNVEHGVSTSNGTVAIHLALEALNIGKGDEVIVPNLTFAATANAVIYTGATPVLVDVNKNTIIEATLAEIWYIPTVSEVIKIPSIILSTLPTNNPVNEINRSEYFFKSNLFRASLQYDKALL